MIFKQVWKLFWMFIVIYGINPSVFADTVDDPCGGPSAFLSIVDRPTIGDSVCAVPFKKAVLELGTQYLNLIHSTGHEQNFPEAEFRLGLPANNEFVLLLPNYIHQSITPGSGFSATTVGIKHGIGYTKNWAAALEGLFTLPNGSAAFGSKGLGATFNGILSYTLNPKVNMTFMLGGSTETQSSLEGGQRFSSINPDMILTYSLNPKTDLYGEVYGQSKTGPGNGSGFNFDGGIIYLLLPRFTIDLEIGQRISGNLGGFERYIGAGMAMGFGS